MEYTLLTLYFRRRKSTATERSCNHSGGTGVSTPAPAAFPFSTTSHNNPFPSLTLYRLIATGVEHPLQFRFNFNQCPAMNSINPFPVSNFITRSMYGME